MADLIRVAPDTKFFLGQGEARITESGEQRLTEAGQLREIE